MGRYTLGLLWYRVLTGNDVSDVKFNDFDAEVKDTEIAIAKQCVSRTCEIYGI